MFNLRKISNVSKRKKWITGFGFIILFLLPQLCLGDLYDITYESYNIFDEYVGNNPSICRIDDTHYLVQANQPGFVFSQIRVVTVDPETGAMTSGPDVMLAPAAMEVTILPIDYTHYFCAYRTISDYGAAVVTVDPDSWTVTVESDFLIDPPFAAMYINASKINENHFLVAFQSHSTPSDSKLWGVVLNVNTTNWVISGGEYHMIIDGNSTSHNRSISIDDTHQLCISNSFDGDANCLATVLTVDLENLTVTSEATYDLQIDDVITLDLAKYDDTHFILDYSVTAGQDYAAYAVVLSVDPSEWSVTRENPLQIDALGLDPDLSRIDDTHYLCSYITVDAAYFTTIGKGIVLTLDPADWTLTMETPNDQIMGDHAGCPMMSKIDDAHYIVVFTRYDPIYMTYTGCAQVLNVELITGWIEGTVSLDGGAGNVEYVIVTAGNTSTNPDVTGNYSIAIQPGTYDVTATLVDYDPVTVENVVVVEGQITDGIDFVLISNVGVDNETVSIIPELIGNYPNPFNPTTNIAFSLSEANHVTLEVYNVKGEKVITLIDREFEAGDHSAIWKGTDDNDKPVSSGVYFYKMVSEGNSGCYTSTRKMILMK
jgi:hypothetical protein